MKSCTSFRSRPSTYRATWSSGCICLMYLTSCCLGANGIGELGVQQVEQNDGHRADFPFYAIGVGTGREGLAGHHVAGDRRGGR